MADKQLALDRLEDLGPRVIRVGRVTERDPDRLDVGPSPSDRPGDNRGLIGEAKSVQILTKHCLRFPVLFNKGNVVCPTAEAFDPERTTPGIKIENGFVHYPTKGGQHVEDTFFGPIGYRSGLTALWGQ